MQRSSVDLPPPEGPEQDKRLPWLDHEVDPLEHVQFAEGLPHLLGLHHRLPGRRRDGADRARNEARNQKFPGSLTSPPFCSQSLERSLLRRLGLLVPKPFPKWRSR